MSTEKNTTHTGGAPAIRSDDELRQVALAHIADTRIGLLAITREDGVPTIRPMGFAPIETGAADVYFTAPTASEKARSLRLHPRVNLFLQGPLSDISAYKAVSLVGEAVELAHESAEFQTAVAALSARMPFFKARAEKGDLSASAIFRVRTAELRLSDYAQKTGLALVPL
ncbi:MAG: pyridoxamine 5'-phosphate oxidase family protein [Puniceicoccales bacterium]|jgi:general stress protein 26|nr:pyridoxamine 5'-phosphate oxidase family protein [Puniceicoccales bacterium]